MVAIVIYVIMQLKKQVVDGMNFGVEESVIDLYYWFDKSTKHKNELQSFYTFCDISYKSLVKHITTRWLRNCS